MVTETAMAPDQVLASPRFFGMAKIEVTYQLGDEDEDGTQNDTIRNALKKLSYNVILYDRCKSTKFGVMESDRKPKVASVRLLKRLTETDDPATDDSFFFIAFKDYDRRMELINQEMMYEYAVVLADHLNTDFKVDTFESVRLGDVFTLKTGGRYMRVRIVKIDVAKEMYTYWALDEAVLGTCEFSNLYRQNNKVVSIPILAVPAIFEKPPTPDELRKFEEKKYCLAHIFEPIYASDHGARKIALL